MLQILVIVKVFWQHKIDKKYFSKGKIVRILGKFDILSTDFCTIMSNFVATDVYALFNIYVEKSTTWSCKTEGECEKKHPIW